MLTAQQVKSAQPRDRRYKIFDKGGVPGLYLEVMPSGGKSWRIKRGDKRPTLGRYPDVSLAQAREAAQRIRSGIHHVEAAMTFGDVYQRWWQANIARWRPSYGRTLSGRMELHALPALREIPISEITPAVVLTLLRPVMHRAETAKKVKTTIGQVMRYAVANGWAERDPTQDLRGAIVPKPSKPMAAITTLPEARQFYAKAQASTKLYPVVKALLLWSILTFQRPGECRMVTWSEIDGDTWRIPPQRMKMDAAHIVPLSDAAIAVLESVRGMDDVTVFPGQRAQFLSNNTIRQAIFRIGYARDQMSAHGIRSMASSILHERGYPPDVIEAQLAHRNSSIRMIYNRALYLDQRRKMMQAWADMLTAETKKAEPKPRE